MVDHCCRKIMFGFIHPRSLYMWGKIYMNDIIGKKVKYRPIYYLFLILFFFHVIDSIVCYTHRNVASVTSAFEL